MPASDQADMPNFISIQPVVKRNKENVVKDRQINKQTDGILYHEHVITAAAQDGYYSLDASGRNWTG